MKTTSFFAPVLLALGFVVGTTGCSTASVGTRAVVAKGPPTYALAVNVVGNQPPTAAQWAALNAAFADKIAARGGVLISDLGQARYIIRVEFLPGLGDADFGSAVVLDVGPNPLLQSAGRSVSRPANPAVYSYANAAYDPAFDSNSAYYRSIYGYDYQNWGNDNYYSTPGPVNTGGSGTPATPPGHPLHHPPTNPVDCPPGSVGQPPPPSYVVDHPHHPRPPDSSSPPSDSVGPSRHTGPRDSSPSPAFTASRSDSAYAPSSSSGSSSYSSSSSSNSSSASYSSPSSSSSYSAPSYTPSYAPPDVSSSSSSSASSSPGPERTTANQQQN